jgi:hypothetical protein
VDRFQNFFQPYYVQLSSADFLRRNFIIVDDFVIVQYIFNLKNIKTFLNKYVILFHEHIIVGGLRIDEENLTFEDGVLFCTHLYQCAIHKTLNGVPEEWMIFYKTHTLLNELGYHFDNKDLEKVMFKLNLDNVFMKI